MIDMLFRMMMDNSDFVKSLKLSSEQVENFKRAGNSVVGTLGKFAGSIGIAGGAIATFDKLMHSTEVTADAYDSVMFQCTTSVNSFFKALANGNFSTFDEGLTGLINRAKEAYESFDQLENTIISFDRKSQQNQADFNDWYNQAVDAKNKLKKNPKDAKAQKDYDDAVKHMLDIITDQEGRVGTVQTDTQKTIKDIIKKHTPYLDPNLITREKYREWLDIDSDEERDELKEKYNSQYEEFKKKKFDERKKFTKYGYDERNEKTGRLETVWYDKPKSNTNKAPITKFDEKSWVASVKNIAKDYQDAIAVYELLSGDVTDELKEISQHDTKQSSAEMTVSALKRRLNRLTGSELSTTTGGGGTGGGGNDKGDETEEYVKDLTTEAGIMAEIRKQEENLKNAKYEERDAIKDTIQLLKWYLDNFQKGTLAESLMDFSWIKKEEPDANGNEKTPLEPYIDDSESALDKLYRERDELIDKFNKSTDEAERIKIKAEIEKTDDKINKKEGQQEAEDYVESYSRTLAHADLSSKEGRQAVARETIESIKALIIAKVIESTMALPFPANIIAAPAAAAGVAGLFSLIPSFSTGGIFDGNNTIGDMNIARVNSGEMILNTRQLRNLFNLLNGNGSSTGSSSSQVEFKIRGKELVGVLDNYNNKVNRVR